MDSVYALGFSLDYLRGGTLFALNMWMALRPESFGFADSEAAVKFSFLSVGIWWALFSMPVWLLVEEPVAREGERSSLKNIVLAGFSQLKETFQEVRGFNNIFLFLAACWLYMDGVDTIIRSDIASRASIGSVSILFLAGGALFCFVRRERIS